MMDIVNFHLYFSVHCCSAAYTWYAAISCNSNWEIHRGSDTEAPQIVCPTPRW